jgi:hydrogenase-4 component F
MTIALWAAPMLAGLIALLPMPGAVRRALLPATAAVHSGLVLWAWVRRPGPQLGGWVALDGPGLLFLTVTSALFLAVSFYALGYLRRESRLAGRRDFITGVPFVNQPETLFIAGLLLFLGSMALVTVSQHFGLMWAAIEATTLSSAPLIYFHRQRRALEAAWKYLLIASVGIALALLGTMFVSVAASAATDRVDALVLSDLVSTAADMDTQWLKAGFILLLVGYGTKMGLAPLHTWLPDAHSEAPSLVSALLSGALLNTAFLGILRAAQVCNAAGLGGFASQLLIILGLLSMGVAAVFVLRQPDYKRMLAYSSVEHMGILAFGVGIGGAATYGAMFHAVNHSMTKAMLFMLAGNILAAYGTKATAVVTGLVRVLPVSGILWLAGFLAIVGSPPFGAFLSELSILKGGLDQERWALAALYLGLLAVIFIGMASAFLHMAQGRVTGPMLKVSRRESVLSIAPPLVLGAGALTLGVFMPGRLGDLIEEAAMALGYLP